MLARVKLRILFLFFLLDLLKDFSLLLCCKLFAIYTSVLSLNSCKSCCILLLLDCSFVCRGLLLNLGWLNVVLRCLEVELNVGLHAANLVVWLALLNVDRIVATAVLDIDCVTFVEH